MATFYGGEQLVGVTSVDLANGTNANVTVYTEATGYYAKIVFLKVSGSVFIDGVAGNYAIGNVDNALSPPSEYSVIINAGDALKYSSTIFTAVALKAMIFKYKKP